ncbi:MAG TPA: hypothetical protein VLK88_07460 [Gemmatimonadales bacterium]|nr:hypothetical protein [Gemmatimonadales bacterium]
MSDQPRDWDKELAAIDKAMARGPSPAAGAPVTTKAPESPVVVVSKRAAFSTWLRVLLGLVLAGAMTQWPYAHQCGVELFFYLGAAVTVIVAGVWSGISSWYRRLGWAHTLSLLVVLWGIYLAGQEILPRVGYAKHIAYWVCS